MRLFNNISACKYWCNTRLLTRLEQKERKAVSTTVKIYFEQKIQSVKEFHEIGNEFPLILQGSINELWTVVLLCNAMSLLIVKDTTNKTETFLKTVK